MDNTKLESDLDRIRNISKIKKSHYKQKNIIITFICKYKFRIPIIIITGIFLFINYHKHLITVQTLEPFFFDEKGHFQWLGLTSVTAIVSLVLTNYMTAKKNRSDLVSKSRIEWIQKNKEIMSLYLQEVKYYPYLLDALKNNKATRQQLDDLVINIEVNYNLLLMNFSDNKDNAQINTCIKDCFIFVQCYEVFWESNDTDQAQNIWPIENLSTVSRDYFKREWEKAKRGK